MFPSCQLLGSAWGSTPETRGRYAIDPGVGLFTCRWAVWSVLASSLALGACSSGNGAKDGGTGLAGSGGSGKSGGSGGIGGPTDAGSPADAASVPPCAALLNCCATINDFPTGPCNTGGCGYEGACVIDAVSLQEGVCMAALGAGGYCRPGSGDAGPAPCGTACTKLAGCCGKLAAVDAGELIAGCMALATTCTTGSEANCTNMLQIMTGVTRTAGFTTLTCP